MGALFVPLAVEAYVTNNKNRTDKEVAPVSPDYTKLKSVTHLGGKLEPKPFESIPPLEVGVHLHFILPDAFTHAVTARDGAMKYPRIPNRWLVTRLVADEKIHNKSWLLESDYLGLDNIGSVAVPYLSDKECPYRLLGRSYPVDNPPAMGGSCLDELTAVGPGDPTFAAYYPNCCSVFGFHDKLEDLPSGDLTYFVMGYYSEEKEDPLYHLTEEEYLQYLTDNQWSVAGDNVQAQRIICHGMVYSLPWRGPAAEYSSNTPTGEVNASIGNTSVEALSALISDRLQNVKETGEELLYGPDNLEESQVLERFLAMLQYDLLDYKEGADGVAEVEDHLHAGEFDPYDGGAVWHIRYQGKEDKNKDKIPYQIPEIPQKTGKLLTVLNEAQYGADRLNRCLNSKRQELFCAWQRYVDLIEDPPAPWIKPKPSKEEILSEINRLCNEIDKLAGDIGQASDHVKDAEKKLRENIAPVKDSLLLEKVTGESFYRARDPVVLLGGQGIKRPFAYGQDGRFTKDGTLACRTSLIDGLKGHNCDLQIKDILACCDPFKDLQEQFPGMLCEAVCLSPLFVALIARRMGEETLLPQGQTPSPIACSEWVQPWISLFLEWSIAWFPTRTGTRPDNSMEGWSFQDIDYSYGSQPPLQGSSYTGRTVITPHSTLLLKYALEKNIERYQYDPELYEKLKKALEDAQNLAVLSQQLSGMWTQLLSLRETLQMPVMERDSYKELADKVRLRLEDKLPVTVVPSSLFFPIRAGFLQVNKVNIINSFGIRQLVNSTLKKTVFSEEVFSEFSKGMFPPRFAQGARLDYEWICSEDNSIMSCLDPATSPICGFLYPDFLNHALSLYEANGIFKGRLKLVYRNGSPEVRWVSAPGEPTDFNKVIFRNAHIKKFAEALLKYNDKKDTAFYGLMQLIEKRMDETCSYSDSEDLFASWSRPLVLARARMSLELMGEPEYSQSPEDFAKQQTFGYENTKIPVYIGDSSRSLDGSIGFFPDSDDQYQTMHCVYNTQKLPVLTDYLCYDSPIRLSPADKEYGFFTILMEAGANTSLRCGMLPSSKKSIPPEHVEQVLPSLNFSFEIDPIVTGADEIKLPLFSKEDVEWTWYHMQKDGYVDMGSVQEPKNVFAGTNPIYMEGFLRRKEQKK
jgi:hypothetical protein